MAKPARKTRKEKPARITRKEKPARITRKEKQPKQPKLRAPDNLQTFTPQKSSNLKTFTPHALPAWSTSIESIWFTAPFPAKGATGRQSLWSAAGCLTGPQIVIYPRHSSFSNPFRFTCLRHTDPTRGARTILRAWCAAKKWKWKTKNPPSPN